MPAHRIAFCAAPPDPAKRRDLRLSVRNLLSFQHPKRVVLMIRKLGLLYSVAVLVVLLPTAGCDRSPSPEELARRQEEQRVQDQKERDVIIERLKAASLAQDQKQAPIRNLQKQIDALDAQISDARSKAKDWRALGKAQEALEAQKYELQRQ
jgi:hypothetical protein